MAFVNFADLITFTRASSATRVNASGALETVTSGNPRFDYDPLSLEARGLLIEEQRTNLAVRASDYSTAWGALTGISLTTGQASPDGGNNATRVECTTNGATRIVTQTITVANGVVHIFSIFLKKGTTNYGGLALTDSTAANQAAWTFDLNAGAVAQNLVTTIASTAGIMSVGGGWYRCWVMITSPGTSIQARIIPTNSAASLNGAIGDNIIVFGAQVEAGSFATSFIPTVASQVTRSADLASITGTKFTDFFNAARGTLFVEFDTLRPSNSGTGYAASATDNGSGNIIGLAVTSNSSTYRSRVIADGVSQADLDAGTLSTSPVKMAMAYAAGDVAASVNGAAVGSDNSVILPAVDRLTIGNQNSNAPLNGHIRSLRYFPDRLPDYLLRELAA